MTSTAAFVRRPPAVTHRAPDPHQLPPAGMSPRDVTLQVGPGPDWMGPGWARRHRTTLLVLATVVATLALCTWVVAAWAALSVDVAASSAGPIPLPTQTVVVDP